VWVEKLHWKRKKWWWEHINFLPKEQLSVPKNYGSYYCALFFFVPNHYYSGGNSKFKWVEGNCYRNMLWNAPTRHWRNWIFARLTFIICLDTWLDIVYGYKNHRSWVKWRTGQGKTNATLCCFLSYAPYEHCKQRVYVLEKIFPLITEKQQSQ